MCTLYIYIYIKLRRSRDYLSYFKFRFFSFAFFSSFSTPKQINTSSIFNLQLFRPEKASAVLGVCVTCIVGACGSVSVYLQHCDL